jgi:ABC-type uncharacterized transport system permease subunit
MIFIKKNTSMKKKYFFIEMFKDQNDINEKSVVGFISFMMMVIAMAVDIVTGITGKELLINQFIFDGFMYLTIASFGIASVDKWIVSKRGDKEETPTDPTLPM